MSDVVELMSPPEDPVQRINGVINGLVSNVDDPEKLGRIKVKYPLFNNIESDWMRVCSFYSGPSYGAFFRPAKNDEVLVAFAQGNINSPYVIGCLWSGVDKPPVDAKQQEDVREIKTKSGQVVRFEENKNERITITDKKNNKFVIDTKKGSITLSCDKNIDIISSKGTVTIKGSNVKVDAKSSISLSAAKIDVKAKGTLTLKGARVNIN